MTQIMPDIDDESISIRNESLVVIGEHSVKLPAPNDYVILWEEKGKARKVLARVDKVSKSRMQIFATYEQGIHKEETRITSKFPFSHLLFNLGPNPIEHVSVAGVKIETFKSAKTTPMGTMYFWHKLDDYEYKRLNKAFKEAWQIINKHNLNKFFPIEIHVRKGAGKYAGSYKTHGDPEKLDILTFRPKDYTSHLLQLVLHELCHGLDFHVIDVETRAKWIAEYHRSVTVSSADEIAIQDIKRDYLASGSEYTPYNEDDELLFDEICAYIEDKHKLSYEDMNNLLLAKKDSIIEEIWPNSADIAKQDVVISEYANTKPVEYFCEALSYYLCPDLKQKLPERICKLCKHTLAIMGR